MSKINLRSSQNFITKVFKSDCAALLKEEPRKRLENIAWPSESLAQLGSMPIGECKRALFYKILGSTPTEPMNIHGRAICDAGIMFEDYHIAKYKKMGMFYDEQVPIDFVMPDTTNKVRCTGRIDAIIQSDGVKSAIEMKSVSAYKAKTTMGDSKVYGLPAVKNLMQAMLYKYYLTNDEKGKKLNVQDVYLKYINRSDGSILYYKVDLDPEGYAIITKYSQSGKEGETIKLQNVRSFDTLLSEAGFCNKDETRLAELRVSVSNIFSKFDLSYDYASNKMLPEKDYTHLYDVDELDKELKLGRLSKQKYNKAKKGEVIGDYQCKYCPFLTKCLEDSGIKKA